MKNASIERMNSTQKLPRALVSIGMRVLAWLVLCLLSVLILMQGGFYLETTLFVIDAFGMSLGFIVVVLLVTSWFEAHIHAKSLTHHRMADEQTPLLKTASILIIPSAFLIIGLLLILSSAFHGLSTESYIECIPWFLAFLVSLSCVMLDLKTRIWLIRGIGWIGVSSSILGIAMFSGILQNIGNVHAGRLQFLFEYANAAGAWFATIILLCFLIDDARLNKCMTAPLTALLLTQSIGSMSIIATMILGYVICSMLFTHKKDRQNETFMQMGVTRVKVISLLLQGIIATTVFVCFHSEYEINEGLGAIVFALIGGLFYWAWPKIECKLKRSSQAKTLLRALVALTILVSFFLVIVLSARINQASGTFVERMIQGKDAWNALMNDSVLGIGPAQWQHFYPDIQSMEYTATVIHNGYLQLGLDAGIFAPFLLLAALVYSIARDIRSQHNIVWMPILFLAIHSIVDFDLQFSSLLILLSILMSLTLPPLPIVRADTE